MGADVHIYPEYAVKYDDKLSWLPLSGRIHGSRDYGLFGKLAGVRGGQALICPRGLPADAGYEARNDNQLFVYDAAESSEYVKSETAAAWVANGSSEYTDETKKWVTHPDWHSHTWLTAAEFRRVLEAPSEHAHSDSYWALLAMLEEMERRGKNARLVLWFDN